MPDPNGNVTPRTSARNSSRQRYGADELGRLWSHYSDENTLLVQRGNFFLVAESMMLVAYTGVLSISVHLDIDRLLIAQVIAAFGVSLAVIWTLISHWHLAYINHIRERAESRLREYGETRQSWLEGRHGWQKALPINELIAYVVPMLSGVMWAILLLIALLL